LKRARKKDYGRKPRGTGDGKWLKALNEKSKKKAPAQKDRAHKGQAEGLRRNRTRDPRKKKGPRGRTHSKNPKGKRKGQGTPWESMAEGGDY